MIEKVNPMHPDKLADRIAGADEDKIKEVLDFLGHKEDSKFIPEHREKYYFISPFGNIHCYVWIDDKYDNHYLLMNNVYRTKQEAEQSLDFQTRKAKLIKEIEDSSDVIDWSNGTQRKRHIWIDRRCNSLRVDGFACTQTQGATYTTNKQFLEELINTRSDEVKELLFGIKS